MKKFFLAAMFITAGSFAMAQQTTQPTPEQKAQWEAKKAEMQQKRADMQKQHMDEMTKDLNLTPAQVSQIQALQAKNKAEREANMQQYQQAKKQNMQEMQAKKAQREAEMKKILTPDQYAKWQQKMQERKNKMQERGEKFKDFQGKGMNKGAWKKTDKPVQQVQ